MAGKTDETKKKILNAAVSLLDEAGNIELVTVRRIAELAGVGVGLINYHYKTREELLHLAINEKVMLLAIKTESLENFDENPKAYLLSSIKKMTDLVMEDYKLHSFAVEYELHNGNFKTCMYLVPVLKEIFKGEKDDLEIRLIAFQLISSLQVGLLREKDFQYFSGYNIHNKESRDLLIDKMVGNLV